MDGDLLPGEGVFVFFLGDLSLLGDGVFAFAGEMTLALGDLLAGEGVLVDETERLGDAFLPGLALALGLGCSYNKKRKKRRIIYYIRNRLKIQKSCSESIIIIIIPLSGQ